MTFTTHARRAAAVGVTAGVVLGATVLVAGPASAAPGDASATGVGITLDGSALPALAELTAVASVGAVAVTDGDAPDEFTTVGATALATAVADATVGAVATSATTDADGSAGSADVADVDLSLFGLDVLTADAVTADAVCTLGTAPTTATTLAGLTLFGTAVTLDAGTPTATGSAALTGDLLGLDLDVVVSSVETTTAGSATATAVLADLTVSGDLLGTPVVDLPVGQVVLATAACETPTAGAAAPVTALDITPDSGPVAGGQEVTIAGTGFAPGATVTFDDAAATDVVVAADGTSITATTPAGDLGPAVVTVTNPDGGATTLAYTYLADAAPGAPTITELDPAQGPEAGGTTVTVTGTGLEGTTEVTFDGVPAEIVSVSPDGTSVVVTSPAGTGLAEVVVTAPGGVTTTAGDPFTYVAEDAEAPALTGVTPDSGPLAGGNTVVIGGTGLDGTTEVTVDGVPATVVDATDTSVTVVVPEGAAAGPVDVTVTGPTGTADLDDGYAYVEAPTATGTDPTSGPTTGGTVVIVGGTGFVPGATTVTICGVTLDAADVEVSDDGTLLAFATPPCAAGPTTIVVETAGGATEPLPFTYVVPTGSAGDPGDDDGTGDGTGAGDGTGDGTGLGAGGTGGTGTAGYGYGSGRIASGLAYTGADQTAGIAAGAALLLLLGGALTLTRRRQH